MYHTDRMPEDLQGVETYDPDCIVDQNGTPYTKLGYRGVSIPNALAAYGVAERWNRRASPHQSD